MTMLTAVSLLIAVAFGLSLFVFHYFFNRFMGKEDTDYLAQVMREMNQDEESAEPQQAKAASAA